MTGDGVNSYAWDRANRLLSMGGVSYQYNGDGNRIQQDALNYILDLQPGLVQAIGDSDGNLYIHSPRGVHAVNDGSDWTYPLTDGLRSVRGYADEKSAVLSNVNYSPIGVPDTNVIGPAFTGEWRSENETQYHHARHLSPGMGVWLNLDPFEGLVDRPMSLNGYSWVEGNVVNATDASGMNPSDCACFCANNGSGRYGSECFIPCVLDGGVTRNSTRFFYYNRVKAARKAEELARRGQNQALSPYPFARATSAPDTDSARFMSIALLAGGFPMTTTDINGEQQACSTGANVRWCATTDPGILSGNGVFRAHNVNVQSVDDNNALDLATLRTDVGLVAYLLGGERVVGNGITFNGGGRVEAFSVEDLFGQPSEYGLSGQQIPFSQSLPSVSYSIFENQFLQDRLQSLMARLSGYQSGDYVFTAGPFPHGFMVTHWGEATTCDGDQPISSDWNIRVPYVADLPNLQVGTPRPFYCSRVSDSQRGGSYFQHRYWHFVKVPGSGEIQTSRVYRNVPPILYN